MFVQKKSHLNIKKPTIITTAQKENKKFPLTAQNDSIIS